MARKFRPRYDVLAKLEEGEPYFPLLGRDLAAPATIRIWAHLWQQEINLGLRPESDRVQITEALRVVSAMEIWHRERENKRKHDAVEWDGEGRPKTGAHAHVEHATTSGANER